MPINVEPPPTYAEVILVDIDTNKARFNPIWLKWFLDLTNVLTNSGAGSGIIGGSSSFRTIQIDVSGNTDHNLTSTQAAYNALELLGVLTGNINVIVPASTGQWTVYNGTTGNFTVTFKASTGTGLVVQQGYRGSYYWNGTNIVRSVDSAVA